MPKTGARLGDYEVLQTIGTGSFGTCKKVRRKCDGKVFVWKEIDYGGMSEKEKQLLVQEVNLLRELRHPHIVRYHDRVIARAEATLYIVMEFCEGGDLGSLIATARAERRYLEEGFVWQVFCQLLQALQECHRKREGVHKVLHRDLKPANVFLDCHKNVKLGDFGLARILHHNFSLAKTFVGTPYYMSPEQLDEQEYDERSDLWSLGCLMYELCALSPPFTAPNQRVLTQRVREGRVRRIPPHFSSELHSTITSLLQVKPEKRPDISSLLAKVASHIPPSRPPPQRKPSREESKRTTATASNLCGWEDELVRKEEGLQRRESELVRKEEGLWRRENELVRKEEELRRRESELVRKEEGVWRREQQLSERERRVAVREKEQESQRTRHWEKQRTGRGVLEPVDCNAGRHTHTRSKEKTEN